MRMMLWCWFAVRLGGGSAWRRERGLRVSLVEEDVMGSVGAIGGGRGCGAGLLCGCVWKDADWGRKWGASVGGLWGVISQSLYHDGGFRGEDRLQGLVEDRALVVSF